MSAQRIVRMKDTYYDENCNDDGHTFDPIVREFHWFPIRARDEMGDGDSHSSNPFGRRFSWFLTRAVGETESQGDACSDG